MNFDALTPYALRFHSLPQLEVGIARAEAATPWGVLRQLAREVRTREEALLSRLLQAEEQLEAAGQAADEGKQVRWRVLRRLALSQIEAVLELACETVALGRVALALAQRYPDPSPSRAAQWDWEEFAARAVRERLTGGGPALATLGRWPEGPRKLVPDAQEDATRLAGLLQLELKDLPQVEPVAPEEGRDLVLRLASEVGAWQILEAAPAFHGLSLEAGPCP
jgi:hypothetical protein